MAMVSDSGWPNDSVEPHWDQRLIRFRIGKTVAAEGGARIQTSDFRPQTAPPANAARSPCMFFTMRGCAAGPPRLKPYFLHQRRQSLGNNSRSRHSTSRRRSTIQSGSEMLTRVAMRGRSDRSQPVHRGAFPPRRLAVAISSRRRRVRDTAEISNQPGRCNHTSQAARLLPQNRAARRSLLTSSMLGAGQGSMSPLASVYRGLRPAPAVHHHCRLPFRCRPLRRTPCPLPSAAPSLWLPTAIAVGVVGQPHRPRQHLFQIQPQRLPFRMVGVGVLDHVAAATFRCRESPCRPCPAGPVPASSVVTSSATLLQQ